ncbi:MFS transporter [Amycolatopsis acidiphila]|uniref:MFS transporter n=1 Tax=Amycolatopsis acidiphila TaxID=715473 RepID=A0A557ZXV9_9PSEU|nr:MFS transporter [Amycolatopsis acidiphila]TVT16842.1 MFS transporter [Amycolatopsis acidiphila]UIJ63046.1 MFS transporter [Amycolatopsis acidiphila]GHG65827.1 MFS sugar transporter [Amycolatopsis acidiphila]
MSVLDPQHETSGTSTAANIAARFERLPFTGYQKRLAAVLATCFMIDGIDLNMLSFLLAPISADLGLSKGAAAWAASAGFIGMGVGATCAGLLADRFGRRLVLVNSMLLWGTASLLTAFAWNLSSFMAFRILTGIGLGAELPVAFALLAEFMPAARRARLTGWVQVAGSTGLVAFNALSLLAVAVAGAVAGWRAMFVVMFVTALFALYVRRQVPESPRWYAAQGRHDRAEAVMAELEDKVERASGGPLPEPVPVAAAQPRQAAGNLVHELFSRGYARRTLLAWSMWLVIMLAFYGITTWTGKLLVDRGMSVSKSILVGLLISAAGIPAAWLTGYAMDRIGRKAVLTAALALVAVAAFAYGHASTFALVVLAGAIMQFALVGVATSLYAYTPELFPTRTRGTGMGTASTAGRISAIVGPLLVPVTLLAWGYTGTFLAFACCFVVSALLVLVFGPESRGRVLEEVSG